MWNVVTVTANVEMVWRDQVISLSAELYSSNEYEWKFCVGHMAGYDNEYDWQHHKEFQFRAEGLSAAKLHAVSLIPNAQQHLTKIMDSKFKNFQSQLEPHIGKKADPTDVYQNWDQRAEYRLPCVHIECRHRETYTTLRLAVVEGIVTPLILNAEVLLNGSYD